MECDEEELKATKKRKNIQTNINFNGNIADISMLLVSAVRYALGRQTYIVQWTCEIIRNNLHLLSQKDKQVMIRDIKEAYSYGDECDEKEWKNLLEILEGEK